MTKGDLDGVTILGRPLKPLALQFAGLMCTLMFFNITNKGVFGDLWLGDVVAVMAAVSVAALVAGWVAGSQKMAESGLFLACIVYMTRTAFLLFTQGFGVEGVYLGFFAAVGAGGAYLLETWDVHIKVIEGARGT